MRTHLKPAAELIDDGGSMHLRTRTARAAAVSVVSQFLGMSMSLGFMAVLARLLGPAEFGLIGMAAAITAFLAVFSQMGLSLATVQKAELTLAQISTLFWMNAAFGTMLAAITVALSPLAGLLYGREDVVGVTAALGAGFVLAGLTAQHSALVMRRMRFVRWWAAQLTGIASGGAAGIAAALAGWGVYALVCQQLVTLGVTMVGMWVAARWMPGRPVRGSGVREMVRFGGYLTGFNVLNYFARNLDKVLLGMCWGAAEVGFYGRAFMLMTLPIKIASLPLGSVMVPSLSKVAHDTPKLREAYLRALEAISIFSMPVILLVGVEADDIVRHLLGPSWSPTAGLLRIMLAAAIWQGVYNSTGWLFVATGRTDRLFWSGLLVVCVVATGFAVGAAYGAAGMALAYSVAFSAVILPQLAFAYSGIWLRLRAAMRMVVPALVASAAGAGGALGLRAFVTGGWPPAVRLTVEILAGGALYLAIISAIRPGWSGRMLRPLLNTASRKGGRCLSGI